MAITFLLLLNKSLNKYNRLHGKEPYKWVYLGHHTYKQIGNSVVVPVLTELAEGLVNSLIGEEK